MHLRTMNASITRLTRRCALIQLALALVLFLAVIVAPARAQFSEYEVKAGFLCNFLQFVKWPSGGAGSSIGVLGSDPFGGALEKAAQGRKIRIQRAGSAGELKDCNLVFISRSERGNIAGILSQLQGAPVLTVSETGSFTKQGGMIDFVMQGGSVSFEINASAAQKAGLQVSSKLLKAGRAVAAN
jgi:hypothetical protein